MILAYAFINKSILMQNWLCFNLLEKSWNSSTWGKYKLIISMLKTKNANKMQSLFPYEIND